MPIPRNAVMLMPWGRVGSNLVNDIVRQTGRSVFNEPLTGVESRGRRAGLGAEGIAAAQADWLRENLKAGAAPWFLNLSALSVGEPEATAAYLDQFDPIWIILDRQDIPATVLSSLRIEAWVAEGRRIGEHRGWAIPKGRNSAFRPYVAPADLRRVMRYVDIGRSVMERMVSGRKARRYWYEDILLDLQGTVTDILHQVGLGTTLPQPRTGRFGTDHLSSMVANPVELAEVIRDEGALTRLILPPPDAPPDTPAQGGAEVAVAAPSKAAGNGAR